MSRVYTDTIEPRKETQDITLGTSGETISVGANSINVNTVKDKGGNTLWVSDGSGNLSSVSTGLKGAQTLISTSSISNGNSIEITSGLDSTYDLYIFRVNVSLTLAGGNFNFQCSTDGGSNYNTTITSSAFRTKHLYSGSTALNLESGYSQAQGTSYQTIAGYVRSIGDMAGTSVTGEVWLFNPASTTFVKQFHTNHTLFSHDEASVNYFMAGYYNTTSAINAISFKPSNGQFYGNIKMYGIS